VIRRGTLGFGLAYLALAVLPFMRDAVGFPAFYLVFLSSIFFWATQSTSWNILSGYSGYFSFGQAAFVGIGAYTAAVLVGRQGWDFLATLPLGGILAAALAIGIGALAFRLRSLRGEIFALLTLAVPFILASIARTVPAIDGGYGITIPTPDVADLVGGFQEFLYLLSMTVGLGALFVAFLIRRTRTGWALFSIHDAEDVAEGLGVPTFRAKMVAIGLSGLIGGLSGAVYAQQVGFVTVDAVFGLTIPLFVIVMSVLGGRDSWFGPLLGAIVIVTVQNRLAAAGLEGWSLIIFGSMLVVLIVIAPDGLAARLRERPVPVAVAFVVPFALLAATGAGSGLVDWLAASLVVAGVIAFVPLPARVGRALPRRGAAPASVGRTSQPGAAAPAVDPLTSRKASEGSVTDPVVDCTDLIKRYGGVTALDGVSLRVESGELVGLVGPNGSGKSTLIGLLSGTLRPTSGTIRVVGQATAALAPHEVSHLGGARTYQIPKPFMSMTVRDNVAMAIMFGRHPVSLEDARQRAAGYLAIVGLERRADLRPSGINLHDRQLLEMARALATDPQVLLLDEALAGLNPTEIDQAVEVVRRIHASGVTIVIVEHLLRVVNQLASRIVVLDQGRLLASGEPAAVMRDPAVVHAYLGRLADA
jgi:branched-chain amino acid transport system permease protein